MQAQCPKCKAVYDVDETKVPEQGRYARCTVCKSRFFISRPDKSRPSGHGEQTKPRPKPKSRKPENPEPAASQARPKAAKPKPKPASSQAWKETAYQKLYRRVTKYYHGKDGGFKYHIAAFCLAHREITSLDQIKSEIRKHSEQLGEVQKTLASGKPMNRSDLEGLRSESLRHRTMIQIFKDIAIIQASFQKQGLKITLNQVLTVLKDVELAYMR